MTARSRNIAIFLAVAAATFVLLTFGRPDQKATSNPNVLRIASESPPDYLDPGLSYMVVSWQTMINVYNGLLTYNKAEGVPGATLTPDLATSMPTLSADGKTYTFTMRKGIAWGPPLKREVLPSDIKYAIERGFRIASPGQGFFTVIEGASEFSAKKADSISGIVVNDTSRTITFTLTRPDATFLYALALPFSFAVPKGTPAKDQTQAGFIPATGPYMFVKYEPQRKIVLRRNPNFKSWTEATPNGNVDGIEIILGVNPENAITMIKRGKVDTMFGNPPRSKLPMLLKDEETKDRVHINNAASTSYIYMDTRKDSPFADRRARQAINWAIDRRAMVKLTGGMGTPSETILPPNIPGFADHKLYPKQDLNKAKQLLAEAGVKPGPIDIWCRTNEPNPTLAVYLQDILTQLDFKPTVKCIDSSSYFTLVGSESTKARIGFANWAQDFPEGSNFIDVLLNGARITPEHSNNLAWYKGADKQIETTNALLDQDARNAAWGKIDEQIVKEGAWAPFMHGITYTFVSERVQNYTHSPVYDMLFMKAKLKDAEPLTDGQPAEDVAKAIGGGRAVELPDSKVANRERLLQRRVGS